MIFRNLQNQPIFKQINSFLAYDEIVLTYGDEATNKNNFGKSEWDLRVAEVKEMLRCASAASSF